MTGKLLLEKLKAVGEIDHAFRFPYVYVRCISSDFEGKEEDERELIACGKMKLLMSEVRKTAADCLFTLQWMTPAEAALQPLENRGQHWLRAAFPEKPTTDVIETMGLSAIRVVHFFGYKGGQGRSSVLACLAQKLAHEGVKVLVLDADIEAPSLDVLFGVTPNGLSSTLLGIARKAQGIIAIPALQGRDGGEVRLIACRPRESGYHLDFAAFALQTSLMPGILAEGIERIRRWAIEQRFDVILVDHRSGMAMTTLTWMKLLPGPAAIFTKLDEQWRGAEEVIREVLEANPENPGVIITFKPDEETEDGFRRRTVRQRNDLLQLMGETIARSIQPEAQEDFPADSSGVEDRWLLWPYDQSFRTTTLPDLRDLGSGTKTTLNELTRLFEISLPVKRKLSSSGSLDQGDLIQTEALTKLRQPNNSIRYILGRKGTGKTRLAKQLALEQLGESLLVDASSDTPGGIKTVAHEFLHARDFFQNEPEGLWWAILLAALQGSNTERNVIHPRLAKILEDRLDTITLRQKVMEALPKNGKRIFLLDGIETAFAVSEVYRFVESLFLFLLALQSEDRFSGKVEVKLFLRTDLASRTVQNLEQQVAGRTIYLLWDYQKILNFLLSRLPQLDFFKKSFPETISEIEGLMEIIRAGEVTDQAGERLILQIFPKKLRRFNILTSTFLRLHFADSSSQGASYYPRVVDSFLSTLNASGGQKGSSSLVEGRLDQQMIIKAQEQASQDYMDQILQELQHLLDFKLDSPEANQAKLDEWINAFTGQITPFDVEEMETHLATRSGLERGIARRCLDQMLRIGIFERSSDTPNLWRAGRLFKSSLKMKYKRI
ncbi:MAG: P-loop NTPase [Deltaproteobacteria bacterium]|nr:P-loop NTPase [Deltaproteobacteria bacterium]